MEHIFFAYCPLTYDGEFYPEAPPGCSLTPLWPATAGLLLCICHVVDRSLLHMEYEAVRPYLVGERLHNLLHSGMRWPPALALARLRSSEWDDQMPLEEFEARLVPLLSQCLERQNRLPATLLSARASMAELRRGEYYWVLQGTAESRWVRWVSADYRLCEGPPELFNWPDPEGGKTERRRPSTEDARAVAAARHAAAVKARASGERDAVRGKTQPAGATRPAASPEEVAARRERAAAAARSEVALSARLGPPPEVDRQPAPRQDGPLALEEPPTYNPKGAPHAPA